MRRRNDPGHRGEYFDFILPVAARVCDRSRGEIDSLPTTSVRRETANDASIWVIIYSDEFRR
jgi:hypothetical protein